MAKGKIEVSIFWFHSDLHLDDNSGLQHTLESGYQVLQVFIFDTDILNKLENGF